MNDKYDVTIFKLIPESVGEDRQPSIKNILTEKAYEALEKFNIFNDLIISKYVVKNYILLYGHLKTDGPGWVENINKNFLNSSGFLTRTNKFQEFAVFIFSGEEYKSSWCVSLGYGYRILNRDCIVKEFGKNYVAKVGDPNEVRMLKSISTAGKRRVDTSHIFGGSRLHSYPFDQLSGVAKSIKSKDNSQKSMLTGSDSLKTRIDISNFSGIKKYLKNIEKKEEYFKNKDPMIRGLDSINRIEDKDLKERLTSEIFDGLFKKYKNISLNLDIPINLQNENIEPEKFQVDELIEEISEYNSDKLLSIINRNSRIIFYWNNSGEKEEFGILDCVKARLKYDGKYYYLLQGIWYSADSKYINRVRRIISKKIDESHSIYKNEYNIMVQSLDECSKGFRESDYNRKLYENLKGGNFGDLSPGKALLDLSGSGHKQYKTSKEYHIEVCDAYKKPGIYIHVKKYKDNIDFDHLCFQAVNSAQIFYDNSNELRSLKKEIIGKIDKNRKACLETASSQSYDPKIICFIILVEEKYNKENEKDNGENKKISDYLSDFSCISLYKSIRQIENMGLEARAFIVEYKKDSEESGSACSSQISE